MSKHCYNIRKSIFYFDITINCNNPRRPAFNIMFSLLLKATLVYTSSSLKFLFSIFADAYSGLNSESFKSRSTDDVRRSKFSAIRSRLPTSRFLKIVFEIPSAFYLLFQGNLLVFRSLCIVVTGLFNFC